MSAAAPLLQVQDLTLALPGFAPVQGLDFSLEAGQTLALVGESGSGKSLTALALMRLLPPAVRLAGGRVWLQGRELLSLPEREMRALRGRELAMVFQEPMSCLNPVLSIGRQIAEVLRRHEGLSARAARARVIELLALVRIPDPARRVDDFPHQLSGGMRQRVMIAMAIACGPRLLIADEPTTALDVTIQAQVLDLLDRLRRELNMGLLLITHDLGLVAQWADRVVVMYAGRACEQAEAEALFAAPAHPYTRALLAASPRLAGADLHYRQGPLAEIPGSIASAPDQPGCAFAPRCDQARPSCRQAPAPRLQQQAGADGRLLACPPALHFPLTRITPNERHALAAAGA
ncbi:ABC transporter ATP-binding protein [Roseateles sp. DAIF2]|uniref:ABC transporter ATP-binding protein n=1 Tax=Roseateles sp. DAIF2 TaxID=2714952 RepID=UPI0018A27695|nr:ABC transporter ATP-binding protein [Roseateles sp. DAIF2]QPF74116.1 ABC transporter ATP-binding protein [Roseateles sp. DAIF2]